MIFFIRLEEKKEGQKKYNTRKKSWLLTMNMKIIIIIIQKQKEKKKKKTKVKERTSMQQRER